MWSRWSRQTFQRCVLPPSSGRRVVVLAMKAVCISETSVYFNKTTSAIFQKAVISTLTTVRTWNLTDYLFSYINLNMTDYVKKKTRSGRERKNPNHVLCPEKWSGILGWLSVMKNACKRPYPKRDSNTRSQNSARSRPLRLELCGH
jgi:hypothetical protein